MTDLSFIEWDNWILAYFSMFVNTTVWIFLNFTKSVIDFIKMGEV